MEIRDKSYAPYLALIPAQFFFGSLPVIGKVVLAVIPPIGLVGIRVGITALILFVIQKFRRRIWLKEKSDYWRFAVLSLFGVVFNQLLFISGLSLTTASNTSLLAVLIPVFAMTVGALLGIEKLRALRILGLVLAACGVIYLIDPRKASFSSATTMGDLLIVINSLSYGIYVAISKNVITRNGTFRSMMWVFIFASVICVPMSAVSMSSVDLAAVQPFIWLLVLHIAVFATAVPYLLNAWALSKVDPSIVAVFVYLQPLIGFVLAVIFLGEKIDSKFVVATVVIFAGVYLVTKRFVPSET